MKEKPKKTQSRVWGIILPKDAPQASEILEFCKKLPKHYYIMLHDEDYQVDETTGEATPKNAHYHVLMRFPNSRDLSTVQGYFKEFAFLRPNSFEKVLNLHGAVRYLTHIDNPEKHQYDKKSIDTNDPLYLDYFKSQQSADDEIDAMQKTIDNLDKMTFPEAVNSARPYLHSMNSYQRFIVLRSLKSESRR